MIPRERKKAPADQAGHPPKEGNGSGYRKYHPGAKLPMSVAAARRRTPTAVAPKAIHEAARLGRT
jgi:hypothetical protein